MLIALCGKPSSGKSTFFKAATLAEVEIASYPFTTIKPNRGIAFVKIDCVDKEFKTKCNPREGYCLDGNRFVPFELMDVAGLISGSHKGLGLGNEFLDDLRQADAFIHIIDISGSTNEKGEAVDSLSYNPVNDIKFLEEELDLWFLRLIKKGWDKFSRQVKQDSLDVYKSVAKQLSGLGVSEYIAKEALKNYDSDLTKWSEEELYNFSRELRIKTKPMIIAANKIDVHGAEKNLDRIKNEFKEHIIIGCSSEIELALREASKKNLIKYIPGDDKFEIIGNLTEQQKKGMDFVKKFLENFKTTGVQEVLNKAVFELLNYIAIFPGGVNNLVDSQGRVLPDCFLLKNGSTALEFAFKIHTDIGNKFIRAIDVKKKLTVGKAHELKHRDVIEIIT